MSTIGVNPTEDEIIAGLAAQFRCPEAVALSWLTQMFRHFNPKAAQERLAAREGATCSTQSPSSAG